MLFELIKFVLSIFYNFLNIFIIIYILYYVITGIFTFFSKKNVIKSYKAKYKFAVIIPARNEENVISHLIESLNKQKYPKKLYDIYVIANNCVDKTQNIALSLGAKVIEVEGDIKTKGEALKYGFNALNSLKYNYDAYCIFDADNIVHPNFLKRMNDTLCSDFKVAQGYRDSKNPADTWISSSYTLFYFIQNYFFNQARMNMNWSSSINGTGFMVSKDIIEKYGFNTVTMTEDIEFAAQCALNGVKIAFVKDAITYDEQPLTFKESWKQRKRWSIGTIECLNKYFIKLIKTSIKKQIPQCFDMAIFFTAPIVLLISFAFFVVLSICSICNISLPLFLSLFGNNVLLVIILGYFATILISIFVILAEKKELKKAFKGIFTLAFFMLTWVPINITCLSKKEYIWEPIKHNRKIDIDNLI